MIKMASFSYQWKYRAILSSIFVVGVISQKPVIFHRHNFDATNFVPIAIPYSFASAQSRSYFRDPGGGGGGGGGGSSVKLSNPLEDWGRPPRPPPPPLPFGSPRINADNNKWPHYEAVGSSRPFDSQLSTSASEVSQTKSPATSATSSFKFTPSPQISSSSHNAQHRNPIPILPTKSEGLAKLTNPFEFMDEDLTSSGSREVPKYVQDLKDKYIIAGEDDETIDDHDNVKSAIGIETKPMLPITFPILSSHVSFPERKRRRQDDGGKLGRLIFSDELDYDLDRQRESKRIEFVVVKLKDNKKKVTSKPITFEGAPITLKGL